MNENDYQNAIVVNSIREEYIFVQNLICRNCNAMGTIESNSQALLKHENSHYDLLNCECTNCGKTSKYLFNIDSFFGKSFQNLTG